MLQLQAATLARTALSALLAGQQQLAPIVDGDVPISSAQGASTTAPVQGTPVPAPITVTQEAGSTGGQPVPPPHAAAIEDAPSGSSRHAQERAEASDAEKPAGDSDQPSISGSSAPAAGAKRTGAEVTRARPPAAGEEAPSPQHAVAARAEAIACTDPSSAEVSHAQEPIAGTLPQATPVTASTLAPDASRAAHAPSPAPPASQQSSQPPGPFTARPVEAVAKERAHLEAGSDPVIASMEAGSSQGREAYSAALQEARARHAAAHAAQQARLNSPAPARGDLAASDAATVLAPSYSSQARSPTLPAKQPGAAAQGTGGSGPEDEPASAADEVEKKATEAPSAASKKVVSLLIS